jgi:hypothetical protein
VRTVGLRLAVEGEEGARAGIIDRKLAGVHVSGIRDII